MTLFERLLGKAENADLHPPKTKAERRDGSRRDFFQKVAGGAAVVGAVAAMPAATVAPVAAAVPVQRAIVPPDELKPQYFGTCSYACSSMYPDGPVIRYYIRQTDPQERA
jgi:hypothetical protein